MWRYTFLCKVVTEFYRASSAPHLWSSVTHAAVSGTAGVDVCALGVIHHQPVLSLEYSRMNLLGKMSAGSFLFCKRRTTERVTSFISVNMSINNFSTKNKWIQFYLRERLVQHIRLKIPKQASCKLAEIVYYLWKLDMFEAGLKVIWRNENGANVSSS